MSAVDLDKWNRFACGPRCLMESMRRNGDPVPTAQEIVDRFREKMRNWEEEPGMTNGYEMKIIVDGLGIVTRSASATKPAPLIAASKSPELYGVLGLAKRYPSGNGGFGGHCVILTPHDDGFEIWSPLQNGSFSNRPFA